MVAGIEAFFFAPISLTSLGVFRIVFGVYILLPALGYLRERRWFLGVEGLHPIALYRKETAPSYLSLFSYLPAKNWVVDAVLCMHLVAAVALTLGFLTPWAAAVCFLTLVSIHHRNPKITYGGDALSRAMCFFLIFADAGHTVSFDYYISSGFTSFLNPQYGVPGAMRLMQNQLAALYFFAGVTKLKSADWRRGIALYNVPQLTMVSHWPTPRFVFENLFLVKLMTWGSIALEVVLACVLWIPGREVLCVVIAMGFHFVMNWVFKILVFQYLMMASLLLFIPGDAMERLIAALIHFANLKAA
jgi:hypothetical protein